MLVGRGGVSCFAATTTPLEPPPRKGQHVVDPLTSIFSSQAFPYSPWPLLAR